MNKGSDRDLFYQWNFLIVERQHVAHTHTLVQTCWITLSTDWQFDVNETYQSLQVLFMQLNIIVSGTVDPQRLHCAWTTLIDHLTVRKVNNFVVGSMDDENHRRNAGHFINATNSKADTIKVNKLKKIKLSNSSKLTSKHKYFMMTYKTV